LTYTNNSEQQIYIPVLLAKHQDIWDLLMKIHFQIHSDTASQNNSVTETEDEMRILYCDNSTNTCL